MALDKFNELIEIKAKEYGSYIEAITEIAEEQGLEEFEEIVEQLNPVVLEKVKMEFIKRKFFPTKRVENSLDDL